MAKFNINEIIEIKSGKSTRTYKGYKGTFATLVYNCTEQKTLPGFYDRTLLISADKQGKTLSVKLSGNRSEKELMDIMDVALSNLSAFPADAGRARFSINVNRGD